MRLHLFMCSDFCAPVASFIFCNPNYQICLHFFFFTFCLFHGGIRIPCYFLPEEEGARGLRGDSLSEQRLKQGSPCPRRGYYWWAFYSDKKVPLIYHPLPKEERGHVDLGIRGYHTMWSNWILQLSPTLLVGIFHLRAGTRILGLRGGQN